MDKSSYYSPLFLAKRTQIINDTEIFDDLKVEEEEFSDLLYLETDETEQFMSKNNIKQFKASKSRVFRFMIDMDYH